MGDNGQAKRYSSRYLTHLLLVGIVLGFWLAIPAHAQNERCFGDENPSITACISGRLLEFWENNGGLAVFGYPLTNPETLSTTDGAFTIQYFERARLELHPELAPPYDVLLGRVGAEHLQLTGQIWRMQQAEEAIPACQYWAETQHNVCGPFLATWQARGPQLDSDPALTDAERLALWGLPLTDVVPVTTADGTVLTQWFERARFEQQPDGSITFGLLGAELLSLSIPAAIEPTPEPLPAAAVEPTPAPNVPFPSVPCDTNVPLPEEGLQLWIADPEPKLGADAAACVRLIVRGASANGANAMTYRMIGGERRPSIPQSTGLDGIASFIFYTGELTPDATIPVEAVVTYRGTTYTAYTEFTPRAAR